jgi:putative Ca2+/H+ antiporter (TMEM165/GDT1 family)
MEWKVFATIFATVFLAEIGDKTQLATMLFAADGRASKWTVFAGASLALIACSALGVLAGSLIGAQISERYLHYAAGVGFLIIGAYTLYTA